MVINLICQIGISSLFIYETLKILFVPDSSLLIHSILFQKELLNFIKEAGFLNPACEFRLVFEIETHDLQSFLQKLHY